MLNFGVTFTYLSVSLPWATLLALRVNDKQALTNQRTWQCQCYVELSSLSVQDPGNALSWFIYREEKRKGFFISSSDYCCNIGQFTSVFLSLLTVSWLSLFRTWLSIFIISFLIIWNVHCTGGRPRAHKDITIWVRVQQRFIQTGEIFKQSLTILCVGLAYSTPWPALSWDSYSTLLFQWNTIIDHK